KVVIDDHSAIATNQRLTKFHGRQPVHMQVSDESSLEKERHERYVLGLMWHVAGAGTGDCGWISLEHKIHDRKIMDGKVPKYAGVLAEKTEVDAGRIVIIDLANFAALDEFANLLYRSGIAERVVHQQDQVPGRCLVN